jgi:ABC-type transport system substrate-binding protein
MTVLYSVFPFISQLTIGKVERIGLIGEYTPSNLPLAIQEKISFGLVKSSPNGSVEPKLALSWETTDSGKQYTFHLADTYTWHSGKTVVAQDINYNIKGAVFTAIDAHTLRTTLQSAFSPFPIFVSTPIFLTKLTGFGPYKVNSLRLKGDKIQLLRLIPTGKDAVNAIEYRFYRSENQALLAYKLGEIDSVEGLTFKDHDIQDWKNTMITEIPNQKRIIALYFNQNDDLVKEKPIRQALAYAVPKLPYARIYSPIAQSSWAYSDDVRKYDTDMEQAKKLLDAVKISTRSAEITIHTFSQYLDTAQRISESWNTLGLKTVIKVENVIPEKYQILLSAQDIPVDPDQYVYWHSTQKSTNISGFSNAKIDKLLEDARTEIDISKRKKLYADFQKKLSEEIPAVFLYYSMTYTVTRK